MGMIRYSDADRERLRHEQEALREERRREALYLQFLCETGRMGIADRHAPDPLAGIGRLDLRWRDRRTDG
jgi:hypothetical protein